MPVSPAMRPVPNRLFMLTAQDTALPLRSSTTKLVEAGNRLSAAPVRAGDASTACASSVRWSPLPCDACRARHPCGGCFRGRDRVVLALFQRQERRRRGQAAIRRRRQEGDLVMAATKQQRRATGRQRAAHRAGIETAAAASAPATRSRDNAPI